MASRRFGPRHLSVGQKFFLVLAVLLPSILAVALVGAVGLRSLKGEADGLYRENIVELARSAELSSNMNAAVRTAVRLTSTSDAASRSPLSVQLRSGVEVVEQRIEDLRLDKNIDEKEERQLIDQLASGWARFKGLADAARNGERRGDALAEELAEVGTANVDLVKELRMGQVGEAGEAYERAEDTFARTTTLILLIVLAALATGLGSVAWLIRDIVPRVRAYSSFAARVAAGERTARLIPRGFDELSDLGRVLNEMVDCGDIERDYQQSQAELVTALQVTEAEQEAHLLLKRHLERSVHSTSAVVLNRNNSANRLEATTPLPTDSPLPERLACARPRSCLAVRLAQRHQEVPGREGLLNCDLCGNRPEASTCQPLLVGGEVIGAVLASHSGDLLDADLRRITDSVTQAAPVLANLRNLAIAEHRAMTDGLTGLPNQRAATEALLRMAAQSSRTLRPLAAILLDLDRFKHINDTYGHGQGDEVLAAVGAVLRTSVRGSDFVGRYGGEEFLVLLPDTDREGAAKVAETIRVAIQSVRVESVRREITASLGIAVLPDDAGDASTLTRKADHALYAAKTAGRNMVVTTAHSSDGHTEVRGPDAVMTPVAVSPDSTLTAVAASAGAAES